MVDRDPTIRTQIIVAVQRLEDEKRHARTARRLIHRLRKPWTLHGRWGRFSVADHLGGIAGAPFAAPIEDVLAWLQSAAVQI